MTNRKAIQSNWTIPFFTIWTGQALSQLGSRAAGFALVWWMAQTTGSATVLATAALVAYLPNVLMGPIVGVLLDRWDRRQAMIVADTMVALATAWLATRFWLGEPQLWQLYFVTFIGSLGGVIQYTAMAASTSLMVPEKHLTRVQGANQILQGALSVGGPPLGALLIAAFSMPTIMGLDVVTAVFAIVPLFFVAIPQPAPAQRTDDSQETVSKNIDKRVTAFVASVWSELQAGFQYVWCRPGLRGMLIFGATFNLIFNATFTIFPLLITDHFGGGAVQLGWAEAASGIGFIVGGITLGTWGGFQRKMWSVSIGSMGMSLTFLAIGLIPAQAFWLACVVMLVGGSMNAFTNGTIMALFQSIIAPEMQGRFFSLTGSLLQVMALLGFLIIGPLTDWIGVRAVFIGAGSCCVLVSSALFFVSTIRNIEDETPEEEPVHRDGTILATA